MYSLLRATSSRLPREDDIPEDRRTAELYPEILSYVLTVPPVTTTAGTSVVCHGLRFSCFLPPLTDAGDDRRADAVPRVSARGRGKGVRSKKMPRVALRVTQAAARLLFWVASLLQQIVRMVLYGPKLYSPYRQDDCQTVPPSLPWISASASEDPGVKDKYLHLKKSQQPKVCPIIVSGWLSGRRGDPAMDADIPGCQPADRREADGPALRPPSA
ncbi:Hypp4353 [Branchiostoma lanceolatum]|uniref:Hypp4353 protein n=1 Tax=Branchiostoma lanceolatum TaxID=7740 RepID=A0A8K0A744_BRALA|nr:Hypp4353 [Branchiostoma lanceolatum]